jgi:hypothetical protein
VTKAARLSPKCGSSGVHGYDRLSVGQVESLIVVRVASDANDVAQIQQTFVISCVGYLYKIRQVLAIIGRRPRYVIGSMSFQNAGPLLKCFDIPFLPAWSTTHTSADDDIRALGSWIGIQISGAIVDLSFFVACWTNLARLAFAATNLVADERCNIGF